MSTMTKDIICITCPQGCIIKVTGDPKAGTIESCEGFQCKRGGKRRLDTCVPRADYGYFCGVVHRYSLLWLRCCKK